jgi:hypothetical protein
VDKVESEVVQLDTFESIDKYSFTGVGYVLLTPFLKMTNPAFKSNAFEYFTIVLHGDEIMKFLKKLNKAGYASKYPNSLTAVARVKAEYSQMFPVRNMNMEIIDTEEIVKGSRVLFNIKCSTFKAKDNSKGVQFQLKWIRKLDSLEEEKEEEELGHDDGPVF